MISVEQLYKSYGKNEVLKNINIKFHRGEVNGIVGENGAGKTTFFNCLAGLVPYSGIINTDFSILKNHMGFLPTQPYLMSRITGWEYLKLMCMARGIKDEDFENQNVFDLPLSQYAEHYSTGMKKKLALMGVLLQKNEIYILDEPFNGVDIHSNMIIMELIARLRERNKTILISSHIFSTLSHTCDNIHLLKKGTIARSVGQSEFGQLEKQMKDFVLGDQVNKLKLD